MRSIGFIFVLLNPTVIYSTIIKPSALYEEDAYIKHFGNEPTEHTVWKLVKNLNTTEGEPKLKDLCGKAHKIGGFGFFPVKMCHVRPKILTFTNDKYRSRTVDVIAYWVDHPDPETEEFPYWFITEGTREDCVFFLDLEFKLQVFKLRKQVCGIEIA